jgi:hypothetical protein
MRLLYHIAKADFLERVRRYSFLVTLAVAVYAPWGFIPPNNSTWSTLSIGGTRGIYNSAWIGAQVAMLTSTFLTLVGFYLIKNSIDRDYQTRVGQILSATPLSKLKYTIGKMLSNAAVLAAIVSVMIVVAGIMQYVRAEDRHLDPLLLVAPFLYTMIPLVLLIGAVAVLFECIPRLRGGLGNVVYFFLTITLMSSQIFEVTDLFGLSEYHASMKAAAMAAYPDTVGADMVVNIGINIRDSGELFQLRTFGWEGLDYTLTMLIGRLAIILLALAVAGVAALPFDRFDSARAAGTVARKPSRFSRLAAWIEDRLSPQADPLPAGIVTHLTPLASSATQPRLLETVAAELRLLLKGHHGLWYLGVLVLIIVGLSLPLAQGQAIVLPIAWIWPTLLWSQLGYRGARQGTNQFLFACARPVTRQLPASWLAGVIVALVVGAGVGLRLAMAGDINGMAAMLAGAAFVPALALACGTWTSGSRLFEVLYLFWWYAGPLNRVPSLDYMGAAGALHTPGVTVGYLIVTAILLVLAAVGRARQIYV